MGTLGAVFPLESQSSTDMKVAITLCIFAIAISSAFAEESSNESLLARVSRDAFPGRRKISGNSKKNQNISKGKKKKTKKITKIGRVNKNKKAQEKKRRIQKGQEITKEKKIKERKAQERSQARKVG